MKPEHGQSNQRIVEQSERSVRNTANGTGPRALDDTGLLQATKSCEPGFSVHEGRGVEPYGAECEDRRAQAHRLWQRIEGIGIFVGSFVLAALVVRFRDSIELTLWSMGQLPAYALAVLVMAVVASAPFSVTDALAIMNGVIFGPLWGSVVNAIGILIAAVCGYLLAFRTCTLLNMQEQIEKLPGWARRFPVGSPMFLIAVRIIPGLGGTVATQSAAAFRVPIFRHVWTKAVVAIPICTVLAIFGNEAADFVHDRVTVPVQKYYEKAKQHLPHLPKHDEPGMTDH